MKSISIKGKDYIEVNERLKYFRTDKKYEGWIINNKIKKDAICPIKKDRVILIKSIIKNSEGKKIAVGHAEEYMGSSFINKTSFVENCETSAVGRALANLGIGIDTSIASADEVTNAINNQETDNRPWLTEAQLQSTLKSTKEKAIKVLDGFKMKNEYKKQITSKFKI